MPLYEYTCDADGTVLELIRPMSQADAPVKDPEGKGRLFKRRVSTFAAGGESSGGSSLLYRNTGSCCPCGKSHGGCGAKG